MTDIPADIATTSSIAVGDSVINTLEFAGDHDWFRITLTAGQKIIISLAGFGGTPVEDPYLYLRDSAGNDITSDDDGGPGRNSQIVFTAPSGGTYYIDVGAWNEGYTGQYQLSVATYTAPPVYTNDQIADQLVNGYWNDDWHHWDVTQGDSITVNLTALTFDGQTLARAALQQWADVIGVNFVEVTSGGQITFDDNDAGAYTNASWSDHIITSAQVNISTQWLSDYGTGMNTYSYQAFLHEIGHALGLGHAGDYNGDAVYPDDALFANDSWATSVMSYFDQTENAYFADKGFTYSFLGTPMVADILAMQALYGLSTTTRSGDTYYGSTNTTGEAVYGALGSTVTIFDTGGNDTLDYSGPGADQLINLNPETFSNVRGGVGNLTIARGTVIENAIGGDGNDTLIGNDSDNQLTGGVGNDVLMGGAGSDTALYKFGTEVTVDLAISGPQNTGTWGTDTLDSIENLVTGNFADVLRGNSDANFIQSLGGADNVDGREGNDVLDGGAGDDILNGGDGSDHVIGGVGNDTIDGGAGNDSLEGGIGNDLLNGSAGADSMAGGDGNDTYYVDNAGDVVTENAGEGDDVVVSSISWALAANVERLSLIGGTANLNGTGNGLANTMVGNAGNNQLSGLDGNDSLDGGSGDDTLLAGAGDDTLLGGIGNDSLDGSTGNDTLNGGTGADWMAGGAGNDTYLVENIGDIVSEAASAGTDLVQSSITFTLGSNIENLTLTGGAAINGFGNGLDNILTGNGAANVLDGRAGADTMIGGGGNDTYVVDNIGDTVSEGAGAGADLVQSSITYALGANVENLALTGGTLINAIGNGLNNVLTGNAYANTLNGNAGADTLIGAGGNDTYYVDNVGDTVTENAGEGNDVVVSSINWTLGANVERLSLIGGTAAINGTGNGDSNIIVGNNGNNQISGLGGDDRLSGGGGNDTILGGAGSDSVNGESGNDTLEGGADRDFFTGGTGIDTFVFRDGDFAGLTSSTSDVIRDFSHSDGDLIDLHYADANSANGGATNEAFSFIGTDSFHNVAGELRYQVGAGFTYVYGDTNGDGTADFMIRLDGNQALVGSDFIL